MEDQQHPERRVGYESSGAQRSPKRHHGVLLSSKEQEAPFPNSLTATQMDDRLPPPQLFISKVVQQDPQGAYAHHARIAGHLPSETTSLVDADVARQPDGNGGQGALQYAKASRNARYAGGSVPKYKPSSKRIYVGYDGEEDDEFEGGHVRVTSLVTFWASFVAMACSLPLVIYAVYSIASSPVSTSGIFTYTMAFILGVISLCVETVTACAPCFPQCGVWKLGRHTMLHCIIAMLSVIPFAQRNTVIALLFLLHIAPAALFYSARIRGEHRAKPQFFTPVYP